ncbi:MAG TPA: protein adenylyltransferase SelO family protein, partial [Luteitalea sp.]|nr:protein adenylyltransferase SelO family protein [Luteitalea sp.]
GLDRLDTHDLDPLLADLFALLEAAETDMTLFFRGLAEVPVDETATGAARLAPLRRAFYDVGVLDGPHGDKVVAWLSAWTARVRAEGLPQETRVSRMQRANPKYVLRNYLAQLAIDAAAQGDTSVIERLLHVLSRPYDDQPEHDDLAEKRPEWARHRAGCSMLSCSS